MIYRSKPVLKGKEATGERERSLGERVVRRVKNLAFGAGFLYNVTFARPPPIHRELESLREHNPNNRRDNELKPKRVEMVAVNKQAHKIDKVAVDASFKRIGNEDVIEVNFEDGSSVKAVLVANKVRSISATNRLEFERSITGEDAVLRLKNYGKLTAVVTQYGGRSGRGTVGDPPVDRLILQSSSGEYLVVEVEPGSIKRVEINDPKLNSDN